MTTLPEGYLENYEEIARDIPWVSTETEKLTELVDFSMHLLGIHPSDGILDVGCGTGHMLDKIVPYGCGIDISHLNCRRASHGKAKAVQADAQTIPFKDNSFGVAFCTDIFEHVPRVDLLVGEIQRVLRPGGILFFACPFEQDLSYYESEKYRRFKKRYRYVHLRSVNRDMLDKVFKNWLWLSETWVTDHMQFQDDPYPIIFQVYAKRG